MRPLLPLLLAPGPGNVALELSPGKPPALLGISAGKASGSAADAFAELMHPPPAPGTVASHRPVLLDEALEERPVRRRPPLEETALDASTRHAAQLAPPAQTSMGAAAAPASPAQIESRVRASLEDLLPALVRRVAWSGDGRRGTVRLELGSGSLAGATLLIHADEGRVRVHLSAPPGVDLGPWRDRIASRLTARGLPIDEVSSD